jgi:acetylornithine/succinyldiaminopimelate/putrescine aminotransferase
VPLAAFMATDHVMSRIEPGDHGGTYAGNLLTCRAGATVLRVVEEQGLVERAARLGEQIQRRLSALAERQPEAVEGVRGVGLLVGLVLRDGEATARIHAELRESGLLVNLTAERVLRLFPALNIPEDELGRGLELIENAIEKG